MLYCKPKVDLFVCNLELIIFKQKVVSQICMKLRAIECINAVDVIDIID